MKFNFAELIKFHRGETGLYCVQVWEHPLHAVAGEREQIGVFKDMAEAEAEARHPADKDDWVTEYIWTESTRRTF